MGELDSMVALVTGASRGIGERIAAGSRPRARRWRSWPAPSSRPTSGCPGTIHDTVAAIEAAGGRAIAIAADLPAPAGRAGIVPAVEAALGRVDILVNNAAVTFFIPVDGFPEKRYRLMFEVQVRAPFELAQAVLPGMRARRRGWVLNISSVAAVHPVGPPYAGMAAFGGTVYGMCKAALERFSTGLAAEVHADGIAVNALSPTLGVATPGVMFHGLIPEGAEVRPLRTQA